MHEKLLNGADNKHGCLLSCVIPRACKVDIPG